MAKLLFITTLLVLLTTVDAQSIQVNCGEEIKSQSGELIVPANTISCNFTTASDNKDLILDTDGLSLSANDELIISSFAKSFTYSPPTDAGYLHIGGEFIGPKLTFTFHNATNPAMVIKFSLAPSLSIDTDTNHNFKVLNVGATPNLELRFSKTINETIHIELTSPHLEPDEFVMGNYLMPPSLNHFEAFTKAGNAELIHVKTTIVDKTCSNSFTDSKKPQEIFVPQVISKPYECVNLFKQSSKEKEAHFDVDFVNFRSLAADSDEIIIRDSSRRLFIDRATEVEYRGKKISTSGKELIITYRAIEISQNSSDLGLRLTVIPESNGGIVRGEYAIKLPATTIPITYTLIPDVSKCVTLETSGILSEADLTLTSGEYESKFFGHNTLLPPIIGTSEPSKQLLLKYNGTKGLDLQFESGSCCHQLSSDSSGHFSVNGGAQQQNETCFWTVATGGNLAINFDENDLGPNGCVTIQSLGAKEPLYSRCNISSNEIIPRFVVSQAYVSVFLPNNGTKFTAFLSKAPTSMSLYGDNITSPGYPVSYPVMSGGQEVYTLARKNYLLNVVDLDLRTGEDLFINKNKIINQNLLIGDDLLFSNTTVDITISRPPKQTDITLRRGFKIRAIPFEQINLFNGNITSNNTVALTNLSNALIKISLPSSRVNYIITPNEAEIELYDGRSISSPALSTHNGSTTSDTLILIAKSTIPSLKVSYWYTACNKTDDLICDNSTRCVPREFQCGGKFYCADGSDMRQVCNSEGPPPPQPAPNSQSGVGGFTVFILCTLFLTLGVLLSTYGPGLYKTLEDRFRGQGQYNSFTSVE